MSSNVAANYTMQPILNTLGMNAKPKAHAATTAASGSGTASTGSTPSADGGVGTTFLNLLVQELQNQDPTAPVDSTAMVGQMISLNQLDQLISINGSLGGSSTSITGASQSPSGTAAMASPLGALDSMANPASPSPSTSLPFDPATMMPVNSTFNPSAAAAYSNQLGSSLNSPLNSPLNAQSLGFSGLNSNSTFGGK